MMGGAFSDCCASADNSFRSGPNGECISCEVAGEYM